jgi:hypothetical protein
MAETTAPVAVTATQPVLEVKYDICESEGKQFEAAFRPRLASTLALPGACACV